MRVVKVHSTCIRGAVMNEWQVVYKLLTRPKFNKEHWGLFFEYLSKFLVSFITVGRYTSTTGEELKWFQGYEDLDPNHKDWWK